MNHQPVASALAGPDVFKTHWYTLDGIEIRQDAYMVDSDIVVRTEAILTSSGHSEVRRTSFRHIEGDRLPWTEAVTKLSDEAFRTDLARRHLAKILDALRSDTSRLESAMTQSLLAAGKGDPPPAK